MRIHRWLLALLLWPSLVLAEPAKDATAFLKKRHAEVVKILKGPGNAPGHTDARNAALTEKLAALLDYQELSKRALVDHWSGLNDGQRKEFTALLSQLVERNYQDNLESTMEYKVRYATPQSRGAEVVVQTHVRSTKNRRAPEVAIDYTLVPSNDVWRVCDVVTDGVSLVANYRSQFNRIIRKEGWKALIERMKKKLADGKD